MDDRELTKDGLADRNLRAIGAHLRLPPAPTDRQRELWKQGPRLRLLRERGSTTRLTASGGRFMRGKRFLLPAGTVAAAAVILAVLLMSPTQRSVVEASTILMSLRGLEHRGLYVEMKDIGAEDVRVNGRTAILFDRGFRLEQLVEAASAPEMRLELLQADLQIEIGPEAQTMPGLNMHVATSMTPGGEQWAYVQMDDLTPLVEEAGPAALMMGGTLKGGLLADFNGLLDEELNLNFGEDADDGPSSEGLDTPAIRLGPHFTVLGEEGPDDMGPMSLVRRLLTGEGSLEDVQALAAKLEESDARVQVEEIEPGLYVLAARDLDKLHKDVTEPAATWLADTVMRITYREGVGVEALALAPVGPYRGALEMQFIGDPQAARILSREDFIEPGRTTVIDVLEMMKAQGVSPEDFRQEAHGDG